MILTIYFITIYVCAAQGQSWALHNQTYVHMNSWFHYAKLYAATFGCIGFMILKYHWGRLGKAYWFKMFPFVIVAINIFIAVGSDFESAIRGMHALQTTRLGTNPSSLLLYSYKCRNAVAGCDAKLA